MKSTKCLRMNELSQADLEIERNSRDSMRNSVIVLVVLLVVALIIGSVGCNSGQVTPTPSPTPSPTPTPTPIESPTHSLGEKVSFRDTNLESAILNWIGKTTGDVYRFDLT